MRHNIEPTTYNSKGDMPARVERLPDVEVAARVDKIIYGPNGEVLKRIVDRSFLGYGMR